MKLKKSQAPPTRFSKLKPSPSPSQSLEPIEMKGADLILYYCRPTFPTLQLRRRKEEGQEGRKQLTGRVGIWLNIF